MKKTVAKETISSELANALLAAGTSAANAAGVAMVMSVVDDGGNLKAFSRMDGAALLSVQISQDKAYTAVSFGIPSHGWFDFIKDDPPLLNGIVNTPRLVVFGGGYPVKVNGAVVGGFGVSGGHYSQDMDVARKAFDSLGLEYDA